MQYKLTTPIAQNDLGRLRAGDTVLLSGTVYTARDAARSEEHTSELQSQR